MSEYVCVFKFECACVRACVRVSVCSLSLCMLCVRACVSLSLSLSACCVCVRACVSLSLSLHVVCVVRCVSALVIMGAYVSANVDDWVGQ